MTAYSIFHRQAMSDLVERLHERAESYRQGGPSSEHTAVMLDEAASRISQQDAELEAAEANARALAFAEVEQKAREWAEHYPQSSDGRNTFILFAEWAEGQASRAKAEETGHE